MPKRISRAVGTLLSYNFELQITEREHQQGRHTFRNCERLHKGTLGDNQNQLEVFCVWPVRIDDDRIALWRRFLQSSAHSLSSGGVPCKNRLLVRVLEGYPSVFEGCLERNGFFDVQEGMKIINFWMRPLQNLSEKPVFAWDPSKTRTRSLFLHETPPKLEEFELFWRNHLQSAMRLSYF